MVEKFSSDTRAAYTVQIRRINVFAFLFAWLLFAYKINILKTLWFYYVLGKLKSFLNIFFLNILNCSQLSSHVNEYLRIASHHSLLHICPGHRVVQITICRWLYSINILGILRLSVYTPARPKKTGREQRELCWGERMETSTVYCDSIWCVWSTRPSWLRRLKDRNRRTDSRIFYWRDGDAWRWRWATCCCCWRFAQWCSVVWNSWR